MANQAVKFCRGLLGYYLVTDQEKNKLTFSKAKCLAYTGKLWPCYINLTLLRNNICASALGMSQTLKKMHFVKSQICCQ